MRTGKTFYNTILPVVALGLVFSWGCVNIESENQQGELTRTIADLKKQVQSLEDLEAIKQLHIRYVNGLTYCDWEDVVDCFSEDAVLEVFMGQEPTIGKAAIGEVFMNQIATSDHHVGKEANLTLHPIVTVDGDTGKANWVIYFITQPDESDKALQLVQGIYDLEYIRENGEWKMSYIKWVARLGLGMVGGPPSDMPEGPPGEAGTPPEGPRGQAAS
jgi:ketosteroid isomerase-like protein